ncbi:MAG: VOC family protein [Deltaproteobacteria bacterium]|nr:VOC family protein [Deltaproteobacteria bacterium]MBI2349011.1 VOC family protein [Deltaproteobacteria bacterium]MBI2540040.1 VOC family protein [Deltaproteobacteria bacterium]
MAKIRHVAILTKDTPRLADFYKTTFGMKEVARGQEKEGMEAIYLSDGYINLAILPARGRPEGIDHFGFEVESVQETGRVATATGAKQGPTPRPRDGRFAEFRIHDPVGTPVDLSEAGWRK